MMAGTYVAPAPKMHNEQLRRRCGATFFARVASVVTTSLLAYLSVAGAPPGVSAQTDVTPTPTATPALALATDTPTPTETAVVVETPVPTITPTPFVSGVPCDGGDPSGPDANTCRRLTIPMTFPKTSPTPSIAWTASFDRSSVIGGFHWRKQKNVSTACWNASMSSVARSVTSAMSAMTEAFRTLVAAWAIGESITGQTPRS